jgi:hypothetical protein
MANTKKHKGKFVIGFDTLVDGHQCVMTEDESGKDVPALYDSYEEAFKELFTDSLSLLENCSVKSLRDDYGATKSILKEMQKVEKTGDVKAMEEFLKKHPELNTNDEFVEKADEFLFGRKAFFTGNGIEITGTKLK